MSYKGEYSLRKIIGNRNFFINLNIEVTLIELSNGVTYEYDDIALKEHTKQWETSMQFAGEYFYHHFRKSIEGQGLRVTIKQFDYMIIETSHIIVVFAMITCLCRSLNVKIPELEIDEKRGVFCFPK